MSTINPANASHSWPPVAVPTGLLSEAQFEAWRRQYADVRAEWIEGSVQMMSPVSFEHADLVLWLGGLLRIFCEHYRLGVVVGPEFMIRLGAGTSRRVPDLMFVSNERRHLILENHLEGAPDLVMEVISPESAQRDREEKFREYQAAEVREYWLLDPHSTDKSTETPSSEIAVYSRGNEAVGAAWMPIELQQSCWHSQLLPGFYLKSAWLVADSRPPLLEVLRAWQIIS